MPLSPRAHWRLTRWLGPWTDNTRAPSTVADRRISEPATAEHPAFEARVYTPADCRPVGSYLVAHGLNARGPDDPRCDRFARVLAHAGFVVMVPRLHSFTRLRVDSSAAADLSRGLQALLALDEHPRGTLPGVFSISFGSFPALLMAASPELGPQIGGLIVFGGYANFVETCRFMMGAGADRHPAPDPTCLVGLAINSAHLLFEGPDQQLLADTWRDFAGRVWGAPDMQKPEQHTPLAHQLAATLPVHLREVFLQGAGVLPGFAPRLETALSSGAFAAVDPRDRLHTVRCPVHLFHGRNDDVIPYSQMLALADGLAAARPRTYLTGLYDHSRTQGASGGLRQLPAMLAEIKTLGAMIHAMVTSGRQPVAA
jgi:pimeloyl-ACP methyl ester carboxylesterase